MRKHPTRAIQPSASKCDSRFSTGRRTETLPFFAIQFCLQLLDLSQQAHKFPAEIGEPVFDARRDFGELDALENPGAGEMTQAVGKDFGADAFDVAFERTGPPHTFGHRPQDADRPTAADHFLQQHFHPARIQFGHGGQKFFIAACHNFTPICKYPTKLCPLSQSHQASEVTNAATKNRRQYNEPTRTKKRMKIAMVILSGPKGGDEALGPVFNAVAVAQEGLQRADEVEIVFNGAGTRWPDA